MLSSVQKTSPGIAEVPYWVFKYCAVELTPVVTYLVNTIVRNGTPPPTWLKALVTPVPKKTPPTELSDLRPISVTPILSRLTERLIVRKYLLPSIPSDKLTDQFVYKPSVLRQSTNHQGTIGYVRRHRKRETSVPSSEE